MKKKIFTLILKAVLFIFFFVIFPDSPDSSDNIFGRRLAGLDYGPFREAQNPKNRAFPSEEEIKEDMIILREMTDVVRIYSVTGENEKIVQLADELGLQVAAGAWLGSSEEDNEKEISRLIEVANSYKNIVFVVVGNEAILRRQQGGVDSLPNFKVIKYIVKVKKSVSQPVTTAEPWKIWLENPALVKHVDFIFFNIHPYWEQIDISLAAEHTVEKYMELKKAYPDKCVVIGETGWPTDGLSNGLSQPGAKNQERFLREFLQTAEEKSIDFFLFEAFDEDYKSTEPNSVGPHWGLYFSDRTPKHGVRIIKESVRTMAEEEKQINISEQK
ncbi:MAG: hypothetical protein JW928_03960 [Candidatus Aureabacteria bacterium]|nr:hypothetical protein [Candidatus Auribacterota bacterium]